MDKIDIRSQEKKADSLMNTANRIWIGIFISLIMLPTIGLIIRPINTSIIHLLKQNIALYATGYIAIILLMAVFAYKLRKKALDIYDSVYPDGVNQ